MLVALRIDTDRCNQEQIFVHVNAIDLDHQQIEAGEIGCHPILHARGRQRYEAVGGGRFRQTSPRRPRNVSLRQPNRSGKLARRDIDQHLVHGPLPEPVLRNCRLPTRYRLLPPVKAAKPWPLDFDLAAVEADLALRFPPAVRPPVTTSRMPWTTDCLRIAIHHLAKGLHAGSQTNQLEARRNLRQGLKLQRSRRNRSRCSKLVHGVAFLCGITTPSLAAHGEQRRFSYFNIERDNSPFQSSLGQRRGRFWARDYSFWGRGPRWKSACNATYPSIKAPTLTVCTIRWCRANWPGTSVMDGALATCLEPISTTKARWRGVTPRSISGLR